MGKRAKSEHIIRTTRSIEPEKCCYDIVLDPGEDKVTQVWVRFGTLDDEMNHQWNTTMDIGAIEVKKGEKKVVARMNDDQLPVSASSCYYQLLCEIEGEPEEDGSPGEPEMLMTDPVLLRYNILENIPSISTTQEGSVQAISELAGYQS